MDLEESKGEVVEESGNGLGNEPKALNGSEDSGDGVAFMHQWDGGWEQTAACEFDDTGRSKCEGWLCPES